jgi:hypothetical protein
MPRKQAKTERQRPGRVERLGFRLNEETKDLIVRAAHLSRRKVSDFCVTALTDTRVGRSPSTRLWCCPTATTLCSSTRWSIRPSRASGWLAPWPSTSDGSLPEHGDN